MLRVFCFFLPDGKVDHVVDFISPNETPEGKAFELDDEHIWQSPQQQLLGGLSVLLTFRTVPTRQTSNIHISLDGSGGRVQLQVLENITVSI